MAIKIAAATRLLAREFDENHAKLRLKEIFPNLEPKLVPDRYVCVSIKDHLQDTIKEIRNAGWKPQRYDDTFVQFTNPNHPDNIFIKVTHDKDKPGNILVTAQ